MRISENSRGAFHLEKKSGNFGVNFREFLNGKKLFHFVANFACHDLAKSAACCCCWLSHFLADMAMENDWNLKILKKTKQII